MKEIKKFFYVLWIIIRNSFYKIITYRVGFFAGLITDFCFNITRVVFVEILFMYVKNLGIWNQSHFMIFFGASFLSESIYMFLFYNSHTTISLQINSGNMDFLLTKPMSEMFMLSFMNVNIGSGLSNFVLGIIFIVKGIKGLNLIVTVWHLFTFILFIFCGTMVYFSISLIINLLSFWFVSANNVFGIFMNVTDLYRYPGEIFPKLLTSSITFIIPLQLISIAPAKYLMNSSSIYLIIMEIVYPILLIIVCNIILKRAILSYTSASS